MPVFADSGVMYIALAVGFVLAAQIIGRALFRRTLFPAFSIKEYVIGVIGGTVVIWAVLNIGVLGVLAGGGLIALLIIPRLLKIKPIRLKLP